VGEALALPLSKIFVSYDTDLLKLTVSGFRIYAISFLFMGYAIFGSGFFTALNDGVTSAIISFLRTLVFQTASVMLLPLVLDIDGIWYSVVVAELMAIVISAFFLVQKRKKYHYM
jgi:Na+-driven multidrug efflux pump